MSSFHRCRPRRENRLDVLVGDLSKSDAHSPHDRSHVAPFAASEVRRVGMPPLRVRRSLRQQFVQTEDVPVGVFEPRRLFRAEDADVLHRFQAG